MNRVLVLTLAAAAAVLAVVLALTLVGGAGDEQAPAPATSTSQATQPDPQVEREVRLTPPRSRRSSKALGIVLIQRAQGRRQIVAAVQGLPRPPAGAYGIWLYTNTRKARWLGFFASRDDEGRLLARGELTAPIEEYREVLVTRESRGNPRRPGPVFLRGRVQAGSGG